MSHMVDIIKVNLSLWAAWLIAQYDIMYLAFAQPDPLEINYVIQETLTTTIIFLSVLYTAVKLYKAVRQAQWNEQDRNINNED